MWRRKRGNGRNERKRNKLREMKVREWQNENGERKKGRVMI
jgi:hypothetical protein